MTGAPTGALTEPTPLTGDRAPWRVDAREQVAGWGLLVLGVLGLGAAAALLPLALDPDLAALRGLAVLEPGSPAVTAGEAARLGVAAGLALPAVVTTLAVALSVLRTGRASAYRGVLALVLLPAAAVAAVTGLRGTALVAVGLVVGTRLLLGAPDGGPRRPAGGRTNP